MADQSEQKGRSLYYHRYTPQTMGTGASYGAPAYGMSAYGATAYGGAEGAYAAPAGSGDDAANTGALSIGRILRVCATHWMTIFVFLVLGLLGSFVVFQLLPEKWEATAYYEMMVRGPSLIQGNVYADEGGAGGSGGSPLQEVFNTRRELFKQTAVLNDVITRFNTEHASSPYTRDELMRILKEDLEMSLMPRSRLVEVTVTARDPVLAADFANAYIETCREYMSEQNKALTESAVAYLAASLDNEEHVLRKLEDQLLDLSKERRIDPLTRERGEIEKRKNALEARALELETNISSMKHLFAGLALVREDPAKFGSLPESIPRSQEIIAAYTKWQTVSAEVKMLGLRLTEEHPDMRLKLDEEELTRTQFVEAAQRAYETCKAQIEYLENLRQPLVEEASSLGARLVALDADIASATMALEQLQRSREIELEKATDLRERVRVAELKADENAATIRPVNKAMPQEKPASPNPYLVFIVGIVLGFTLGVLFVLLLDRMEDKLVGVADIEQRLRMKALAVFPHLRRKQRSQVALVSHEEPFSQYAESMAGLRNLLDSPRYHDFTKVILCMSTMPAEGKTCSSTNLAIAYAQSGQRTLLVDFDMRRPRLAGIFGRDPNSIPSLPHILARNDVKLFDTLPQETQVPSLHVVYSRASRSISPSVLMGTNVITEFFTWARAHYDHIIIDSPPYGLVGDVIVLANLVDSVLLVATPDKTRFGPISFAARRLTEVGARLLGVIVNNVDFGHWGGFGKYENRYGYATSTYVPRGAKTDTPEDLKNTVFTVEGKVEAEASKTEQMIAPDDQPIDNALASDDD